MENYSQLKKEQKKETIFKKIVDSYFAIMLQLLKNKSIDQLWACVLIFIMFSQVIAGLFERDIFSWRDDMLLETFQSFCDYIRIVEAINQSKSAAYYWIVFYFGLSYLLLIAMLLIYLHYSLTHPAFYFESIVQALRYLLMISQMILFLPFFEIFISVFRCDANGYHYIDSSLQCYSTYHSIVILLTIVGLFELILLNVVIALLYNETQPVKEDALSRLDSNFEILMLIYRILIGTLSQYCLSGFCSWIIIAVCLLTSMYFLYQYYLYLPYYNSFVSIFFGCMIGIYFWISVNALLTEFFDVSGNIIVILIGIPFLCQLIKSMRENRIEQLMTQTTEQMNNDIDSLNQIILAQDWLRESSDQADLDKEMKVKGLITLHIAECEADDCVCKNIDDLYDHQNDRYLSASVTGDLHSNQVFVNHFNKQLYSWALNKFINSPSIHISFAFYQFSVMRNIHAALHELKIASKKRPTIQQQFTIFRYQNIIETYIKKESDKMKHIYEQLTNVKEFEKLFQDMQKQIEKVCNYQVEFWTHLTTVVPDLNHLNELNIKIYNSSQESDRLWESLCEINSNYPQALTLYGEYLTFIRNNQQAGKEYFDQAHNVDFAQKSIQDQVKRSDILFTEDSTVVHISGNRESTGRILKVSQGLFKCFGFSKQEIIGHNINLMMPTLFGDKHNDFLECYYRTGRANIFNKERQLFASNRTGYCFTMKILIKQMPSLKEEIQYVGMIKPISTDYEYIITDMQGNIDSFTSGIGSMLSMNPQLFKDQLHINIQIIAPDLISIFEFRRATNNRDKGQSENNDPTNYRNYYRRPSFNTFQYGGSKFLSNNRYSVPGGDALTFIIPNNFANIIKSEKPAKSNRTQKKGKDDSSLQHGVQNPNKFLKSAPFREFLKYLSKGRTYVKKPPDVQKLLTCKEYRECDVKKMVNIEIREWAIPLGNNDEKGLKLLLFMIAKNQQEKKPQDLQSFDGPMNGGGQGQGGLQSHNNLQQNTLQGQGAFGQASLQKSMTLEKQNEEYHAQGTLVSRSIASNQKYNKNPIADLPPTKKNANNQNPLGNAFQSSGLSGRIQGSQQFGRNSFSSGNQQNSQQQQQFQQQLQQQQNQQQYAQLQNAMSFLEIDPQQQQMHSYQDPLTPVREETINYVSENSPLKPAKKVGQHKRTGSGAQQKQQKEKEKDNNNNYTDQDSNSFDPKGKNKVTNLFLDDKQDPNAIDLNDIQFERQETDEQEEDNEHEIDTDRIDVKREIVLNDEIKQNTKSFEDNYNKSDSKLSLKLESKNLNQQSRDLSGIKSVPNGNSSSNTAQGVVGQIQSHNGAVSTQNYQLSQENSKQFSNQTNTNEERKNQLKNKPVIARISQSRDDDEGAEDDEGFEDEDGEDGEGPEEDDEFEDGDDDDDEEIEDYDMDGVGRRTGQNTEGNQSDAGSQEGSDDELVQSKGRRNGDSGSQGSRRRQGGGLSGYGSAQNSKNLNQNPQLPLNQQPEKKQKMRDYTRIVTNPRYKPFDDESCGSAYFNDCNCSERELDIREMIKKNQANKKRREKRRMKKKEEEEKKTQSNKTAADAEDSPQKKVSGIDVTADQTAKDGKEAEDKSKSKGPRVKRVRDGRRRKESQSGSESKSRSRSRSRSKKSESSEEQKNNSQTEEEEQEEADEDEELNRRGASQERDQELNDEGEVSSIASSQQSQARTFFSLRTAIDEKFIPLQIKNLRWVANIVWIIMILLAVVYYVIQITLFTDIHDYIQIIINSEKRVNDIMRMNLNLNTLMLINEGYLLPPNYLIPDKNQYIQSLVAEFVNSTTELKNSQALLESETSGLSDSSRQSINPDQVILQFQNITGLPSQYSYTIWEAIMEIVVSGYKLAETPQLITHSNPDAYFITYNCMNSVMNALQESTDAIINQSDNAREQNIQVFMYLLIAVSCALLISLAFLMPVIKKAKYNKQEVFELFTHKKIEKCIDDQLKKCRWFITKYQSQAENQAFEAEMQDNMIEENTHIPEKEMKADDDKQSEYMKNYKKQKKKWKRISINFSTLILKFSIFVLLIEGFFMFDFFMSQQFLGQVSQLTTELRLLIQRQPINTFMLILEKELIYTNNTGQFLFQNVDTVLLSQYSQTFNDSQDLLTQFSENYNYHSALYNNDFSNIVYGDMCQTLQYNLEETLTPLIGSNKQPLFELNATLLQIPINMSACEAFNEGILQKGIYNSQVKFWTQLQQIYNDFLGSNRNTTTLKTLLNHPKLILSDSMSQLYFEDSYWHLVDILKSDIDQFFTTEFSLYQAIFIIFVLYLFFIYFLIWRIFIQKLVEELWQAKSVLSVLPVEVCFRIEEIRNFIYQNSSTFTGANG